MLLFGAAFVLRLIFLNQPLWLDEAVTAKVIRTIPLMDIAARFSPADFHPPLFYIFMKMWSMLFGTSEIALRMPSVIFSVLAGHAVFLIGTRMKNVRFGLWAAALYLFNPLAVYYSQEARMYSLVTFLFAFILYFAFELIARHEERKENSFVRFFRKVFQKEQTFYRLNEPTLLILLNVFVVLAMWTFYGSVFFVAAILFLFILRKKHRYFFLTAGVLALCLILEYPLLSTQLENAQKSLAAVSNWTSVLGTVSLKNLMLIPVKFSVGRISFHPKIAYYLVAGFWTLFMLLFALLGALRQRLLSVVFLVSLTLGFLFSFISPMLQYFRFLYLLVPFSLLVAEGVEEYLGVKKKKGFFHFMHMFRKQEQKKFIHILRENAVFEILLGGLLFCSLSYLLIPQFHREDWRSLAKSLPADKPVYMILSSSDPLLYYRDMPLRDLRKIPEELFFEQDIVVVPYTAQVHGLDYESALHGKGCYLREKKVFREVFFERWSCGFRS